MPLTVAPKFARLRITGKGEDQDNYETFVFLPAFPFLIVPSLSVPFLSFLSFPPPPAAGRTLGQTKTPQIFKGCVVPKTAAIRLAVRIKTSANQALHKSKATPTKTATFRISANG